MEAYVCLGWGGDVGGGGGGVEGERMGFNKHILYINEFAAEHSCVLSKGKILIDTDSYHGYKTFVSLSVSCIENINYREAH